MAEVTVAQVFFDIFITAIFITVASMLLFPMNKILPIDRRLASLLGAVLCTVFLYAFPTESDRLNPGAEVDFNVLIILTSIMAINYVLLRQPYILKLTKTTQNLIREDVRKGFLAVSVIALLASPLITNDGLCLMLVHPVLDAFEEAENSSKKISLDNDKDIAPTDKFYFMLAIACSANIGSAMTYCGNPQNIIVATYLSKYMNGGQFFGLMFVPSMVSWVITMITLNYFRVDAAKRYRQGIKNAKDDIIPLTLDYQQTNREPIEMESLTVMKTDSIEEATKGKSNSRRVVSNSDSVYNPIVSDLEKSEFDSQPQQENGSDETTAHTQHEDPKDPFSLPIVVFPWIVILVVFQFTGVFPLAGLYAVLSVLLVVVVILTNFYYYHYYQPTLITPSSKYSTAANNEMSTNSEGHQRQSNQDQLQIQQQQQQQDQQDQQDPDEQARRLQNRLEKIEQIIEGLFHEIDYNLLIIFIGLFIVSGSFLKTNIPVKIWQGLSGSRPFMTAGSLIVLSIYIIIASQLVGNVPVVFMAKDQISELDRKPQIFGWLILAFVSTIAGNFTLVGSAANIIVVEKAMRHKKCPVKIEALPHFKYCGVVTLVCIVIGVLFLYLECLV